MRGSNAKPARGQVEKVMPASEDVSEILKDVRRVFGDNMVEVYVVGSYMRQYMAGVGLTPRPDYPPRDVDLLVMVRDVERAIEQYGQHRLSDRLHIGFNDKLWMDGVTHLKIYPRVEVNNRGKASMRDVLRFLGCFVFKKPSIMVKQAWVLRRGIWKCIENLRYPFFNL